MASAAQARSTGRGETSAPWANTGSTAGHLEKGGGTGARVRDADAQDGAPWSGTAVKAPLAPFRQSRFAQQGGLAASPPEQALGARRRPASGLARSGGTGRHTVPSRLSRQRGAEHMGDDVQRRRETPQTRATANDEWGSISATWPCRFPRSSSWRRPTPSRCCPDRTRRCRCPHIRTPASAC